MNTYGVIGRNISYSFSPRYFTEKFSREGITAQFLNFDLPDLSALDNLQVEYPNLRGASVTIPYKEEIIPLLDQLDPIAREIGAVNCVKFHIDGKKTGYNTDFIGFRDSLRPHLKPHHKKALILGTGGASKAIEYALRHLGIEPLKVSRHQGPNQLTYQDLDATYLEQFHCIINCTPLGTHPNVQQLPDVPTHLLGPDHLIFDLIYNPANTELMKRAAAQGAVTVNGYEMLVLQAEAAWKIWND